MNTPDRYRWVAAALVLLLWTASGPAVAQLRITSSPHTRVAASDVVTQYMVWEGDQSLVGLSALLPTDWRLFEARLSDADGRFTFSLDVQEGPRPGTWTIAHPDQRIRPGQRIRLSMSTAASEAAQVEMVPLVDDKEGVEERSGLRAESVWDVVERPVSTHNQALALTGNEESAPLMEMDAPALSGTASWTLTWWLRSSGLDQVVLSAWSGYESDPYPIEAVLDEKGHLTLFTGREGNHYVMRSAAPIADGTWHAVAVVHDAEAQKMRMHVDGEAQDSLKFSLEPSRAGNFSSVRLGYRLQASRPDLSRPLVGELDGVQLVQRAMTSPELDAARKGAIKSDPDRAWELDFDDPASSTLADAGIRSDQLVPSILSVRHAASELRVDHVPEGILLSFEPGDDEVERYRIDVSADGQFFRNAAILERGMTGTGRIEWMDRAPSHAVQHYRVTALYPDGPGESSPVIKVGSGTDDPISRVQLEGNFPNPFNPTTTIRYEVFEQEHVRVSIWDLSGQMISQPVDGPHQPGRYEVGFDAGTLPSGTYFVRLESLSGIQTHQMILMK